MSYSETIARPYAKAVYQQALVEKNVEQWQSFLQISAFFAESKQIGSRLSAPSFLTEFIAWVDECLVEKRGKKIQETERNLLQLLYDNERLSVLPEISKHFDEFLRQAEKTCQAIVYTAKSLDNQQKTALTKMLEAKVNKKVVLDVIEQSDLLAGVRIEYDGLVLDQSTKGRMEQFARKLEDLRK